jgi:hypothetical protein
MRHYTSTKVTDGRKERGLIWWALLLGYYTDERQAHLRRPHEHGSAC